MSPNERRKKLHEYLEIMDGWVTIKELSNNLGVSERTIHTDIEKINESLITIGSTIEKKRGVGVRLLNHIATKESNNHYEINGIDDRRLAILDLLLIQNKVVTYNDLSQSLFVSPSSIKNDIEDIKDKLKINTNVKIVSDLQGTKIEGNEIEIREALIWLNEFILDKHTLSNKSNMNQIKQILKQFYAEEIINVAYDILFSFVLKNNSLLSDYYIFNTLNVYIVQLHRLIFNNTIDKTSIKLIAENIGELTEFKSGASELLNRARARLSFDYTEEEIKFLSKYLILNRFEILPSEATNNKFIDDLVKHLSNALGVDFNQDKKLMKELEQHVPPMIYRLKLGIRADNPFVEQIKNEFGPTFQTMWLAINNFESKLKLEFNDDEVALLTIYFQSAIEKQRKNKRILVVCQYGIATSELLVNRLRNELTGIDTIESASIGELGYFDLESYDLIVSSTTELKGDNIINVAPFLNTQDIEYIKENLGANSKVVSEPHKEIRNIFEYLDSNYIFFETTFENRETLLEAMNERLIQDKYIHRDYMESLVHRESIGNTDLPDGVAIPHGDINLVNKSLVIMISNTQKIQWNKYYVDKIFILLISKQDVKATKKIVKELYALINNKSVMSDFSSFLIEVKEELD